MRSGEQLCSHIATLLETATGGEFLKRLFWELLGYRPAGDPVPADVMPASLAPFVADATIFGYWESITILHVRFAASLPMATHEHEIMRRAGLVLPGTIGIFSNSTTTASDICFVKDDGTLSRISLHSGIYNTTELSAALAKLRTFDLETSQDVPGLAALAEVEQAFSRMPERSVESAAVRAERRLRANRSPLLAIIDRHPLLTGEEERALGRAWQKNGDVAARDKLIYSNLRLAIWVVASFPKHPMPFDDMLQQACLALKRAAELFDPEKGFKFSTLAVFSMKRRLQLHRRKFGYAVYLPPHMHQDLWHFRKEEPLPPSKDSPAEYRQKYRVLRGADQAYRSPISIGDLEDRSSDRELELREHREHVAWAMSFMEDARLRRIIELRFGLTDEPEMTLEQVGEVFKVTRERIRQLEESALAELRLIMSAPPKPPVSSTAPTTTPKWDWNDPRRNIGKKVKFKLSPKDPVGNGSKQRLRGRASAVGRVALITMVFSGKKGQSPRQEHSMSLHDVIDNRGESLSGHINRVLTTSESAKFAVGYFFLSGFEALADRLDGLKELKLLIGNTSTRETIEQMAEGYRRLDLVKQAAEQQQYRRRADVKRMVDAVGEEVQLNAELMEQTDQAEKTIRTLVRMIEEKRLVVRVYTKGRLHAKAYLFDYGKVYDLVGEPVAREENGLAIVGSSNLSLAGISHNTELNVVVHGNANHAALREWFNRLWEESEDFNETLMRELHASWALNPVTPYDIYMKTLYALVKDRLDGDAPTQVLVDTEIESRLADFQKVAVRVVNQMINEHDGAFVADVVGLGKSYIGAAIIKRQEQQSGARALVICPAPLVDMWEHYRDAYDLHAAVVSMGLLGDESKTDHLFNPETGIHKDRDFVLIDESHNFRNSTSSRYEAVQKFLAGGRRRCCLLTATPRNKSAWDVYNQLRLFHPADKTDLPINPPDLRLYFREVEAHTKSLQDLLRHVLYRRTRRDVLRYYGFDSQTHKPVDPKDFEPYIRGERKAYVMVANKPQYFPKRQLQTIEYSIENTYRGLYQQLRNHMGKDRAPGQDPPANELTYARYGLGNYIRDEYRDKEPYQTLQTSGSNLRGLVRVLLFKRFESSVHAFQQSLRKLLRIHEAFVSAMSEGFIPAGEGAQRLLYEAEDIPEEDFLEELAEVSRKYQLAAFDTDRLKSHLQHDIGILKKMLQLVEPIAPKQDAKLLELKARMSQLPLSKGKCLIFTQFADTAKYLFDNLNPGGTREDIEVAYSGHKSRMKMVRRFSPNSNRDLPVVNEPELNTVIATDVFSEGLNLQDCDKIVNYDLHWNPVRLIQRFGRIDRIGSGHETIYGFNFLPETAMDQHLDLKNTLRNRIREIHETIGEDAKILDDSEEVNERAMYAIYDEQNSAILDEEEDDIAGLVNLNEAEEMLRKLKAEHPAEYKRIAELPDGVRSAKDSSTTGFYVFCEASYPDRPEVRGYQQLYHVSATGEIQTREIPRILRLVACTPETPTRNLPSNFNESVTRVRRYFAEEVKHRESELKHTVPLSPAQRYLLRELKVLFAATIDEEQKGQINLLEQIVRMPPTQAVAREYNSLRRGGTAGHVLKDRLAILVQRHGLSQREMRENFALEKPQVKIVCSEALLQ